MCSFQGANRSGLTNIELKSADNCDEINWGLFFGNEISNCACLCFLYHVLGLLFWDY